MLRRERAADPSLDHKAGRVRLLSAELDIVRTAAVERTRALTTKASFVVVAAGLVASATGLGLVNRDTYFVGLVPFILTIFTVLAATVALWPRQFTVSSASDLVSEWLDSEFTEDQIDEALVTVKMREAVSRDDQNEKASDWTKRAFVLLLLSLVSALAVATFDAVVRTPEEGSDEPQPAVTEAQYTETRIAAGR